MTTILLRDRGWEVMTSAWTAASKSAQLEIAYVWGADGISWFDSSTGVSRVTLNISMQGLTERVESWGSSLVDLRDVCA